MKVLIFGSTGSIGRQLVGQALAQGHMVTAFVRNPLKAKISRADVADFVLKQLQDQTYLHQTPWISY